MMPRMVAQDRRVDVDAPDSVSVLLDRVAANVPTGLVGELSVLPQPGRRDAAVLAFTGHSVVVADVDEGWVRGQIPAGDLSAPLCPPFLSALAARLDRRINNIDMIAVAAGAAGQPPVTLVERPAGDHPRVARALRYRDDVRVWSADGGMVLLGRGLAGRWEVAVEVEPSHRGRGLGRLLAAAARHLLPSVAGAVPGGQNVWAQIAPGNAASVRAFLAAGFVPVGAEALLVAR